MTQDNHFSFDNNVYPPSTGTGHTLLADTDIVNSKILEFYRGVLQANLNARWTEACTACGMVNSNLQNLNDGYIIGDALCYPIPETLKSTDYKFPILSVYRQDENYLQMSTHHIVTESNFVITFTLPPLNNPKQANSLYPFLNLVSKTLMFYTFEGNDPKYNNGELVWKNAGFAFAMMDNAKFGSFLGQDGKTKYPSVQINFKVFERNHFVPGDYEALTGFDGYVDSVDGYSINNPVVDFIKFTANPGLTISSFSPSSGSIQGNQMIVIQGTGFQAANLTEQSQITIAGKSVLSFLVKSQSTIIAITAPIPTGVSGPIVITDEFGNTTTSITNYTYS